MRFIDSAASARFFGSSGSSGGGVLIVPTAQNLHPLVHSCPAIMNVASPLDQHSWILGHLASSQTVCNLLSLTDAFVSLNNLCCSPVGNLVLNQLGNRFCGFLTVSVVAMGRCLDVIVIPFI